MRLLAHEVADVDALERSGVLGARELAVQVRRSGLERMLVGEPIKHDDGAQRPLTQYWISPEVLDMIREVGVKEVGWPTPLPERGWWAECEILAMRCGALFSDREADGGCTVILITQDRHLDGLWNNAIARCHPKDPGGVIGAKGPADTSVELLFTAVPDTTPGMTITKGILSIVHCFLAARRLMEEPRILAREETPPPREVRRAAERAGRAVPRPVEYVTIHVSKREREARDRIAAETERTGKVFHKVRTHLRVRETGRVERVREHWRGDPGKGRKNAAFYRVVK